MKAEYINPFISALSNTFATMLDTQVRRGKVSLKADECPMHEITGVIGLSSDKAVGAVVLSVSENVALQAASAMLLTEVNEVTDEVVDAIGELTNVVAGAGKAELEEYHLSSSLPNVITGRDHAIRFPSETAPICVHFESDWGPLTLEVGLTLVPEPAGA